MKTPKTLIVANFPKQPTKFKKYFSDVIAREDVIFIENPESLEYLEQELKKHAGEYDRVAINTHGSRSIIPKMNLAGTSYIDIVEVVKIINQASPDLLVRIDLSSCYIGSNFNQIEKHNHNSKFYQNLEAALQAGQILNLHGDDNCGLIGVSFSSRLRGIVDSKDYATCEAIFDSSEALFVVIKDLKGSLYSCSNNIFTKDRESVISYPEHLRYLSAAFKKAAEFDAEHAAKDRVEKGRKKYREIAQNPSESKVDFEDRLYRSFQKSSEESEKEGIEFVSRLRLNKISLNFQSKIDGITILITAVDRGYLKLTKYIIEALVEEEETLDIKSKDGRTALMYAAPEGRVEIAKMLIEAGADTETQDNNGWNALIHATRKMYKELSTTEMAPGENQSNLREIVTILVESKTNLNTKNYAGNTALMLSAEGRLKEVTQILIEAGADLELRDKLLRSALIFAVKGNSKEITKMLIEAGADIDIKDANGWNVLRHSMERMLAIKSQNQEALTELFFEKEEEETKEII